MPAPLLKYPPSLSFLPPLKKKYWGLLFSLRSISYICTPKQTGKVLVLKLPPSTLSPVWGVKHTALTPVFFNPHHWRSQQTLQPKKNAVAWHLRQKATPTSGLKSRSLKTFKQHCVFRHSSQSFSSVPTTALSPCFPVGSLVSGSKGTVRAQWEGST